MSQLEITWSARACLFLFILPFNCMPQSAPNWTTKPPGQWPLMALTNNVQYKNGDQYIHPSFSYAGTAFLIDNGQDTLAVTAKHVLWIARNKRSSAVQVNRELKSWVLKSKGNSSDSVVIDKLLNEDSTEILEGPRSTILERDWLVFSIKSSTPTIYTLRPRYSSVKEGERVYIIGNPYNETRAKIYQGEILRKLGMDILIDQAGNESMSGTSGAPVIDANGFLIGIFSSRSADAITGKDVSVAISTEYLRYVLDKKAELNSPKKDYGELIFQAVINHGTKNAIRTYKNLTTNPINYYVYNLRSPNRNGLLETGQKLIQLGRYRDAVDILKFNVKVNGSFFHNYNELARAWLLAGNRDEAIKNYKISTTKYDDRNENPAFKELEKLDASPTDKVKQ